MRSCESQSSLISRVIWVLLDVQTHGLKFCIGYVREKNKKVVIVLAIAETIVLDYQDICRRCKIILVLAIAS